MVLDPETGQRRWTPREIRYHLGCPLRIVHEQHASDPPERHPLRNPCRRLVRQLLHQRYPGGVPMERYSGPERGRRTLERLESDVDVVLYDAQLDHSLLTMRFPLIVQGKREVTLFLTYERLWRSSTRRVHRLPSERSSLYKALQEGALGRWALRSLFPDRTVQIRLVFPDGGFRSGGARFFERLATGEPIGEEERELLVEVDAGEWLDVVEKGEESLRVHQSLQGLSLQEQMEYLEQVRSGNVVPTFGLTSACQGCRWRLPVPEWNHAGCWKGALGQRAPEGELFDLIGRGNREALAEGWLEPGHVPLPDGWSETLALEPPSDRFSTSHRRTLQILHERESRVPKEWARTGLWSSMHEPEWPLHFIDFEAAACPIPLSEGKKPYESVLFQFSCHTMQRDGSIQWNGWLETEALEGATERFAENLLGLPEFLTGTVVHYSPFERQALGRLESELSQHAPSGSSHREMLRERLHRSGGFLDMGHLLRDFYHHVDLNGSLGLKAVLPVLLREDPGLRALSRELTLPTELERAFGHQLPERPYESVVEHGCPVGDGVVAVHAWLSLWMPRGYGLPERAVVEALQSYCWLDTWSMVLLYRYWKRLEQKRDPGEDWIQF